MKIVLVIDQFDDANNGTTISARRFAQALKNHGNEVRVIATGKPADYKYAVRQMRFFPVVEHLITSQGMRLAIPNRHVFEKAAAWADVVHFMMPSPLGIMGLKHVEKLGIPHTAAFHCQPENITFTLHMGNSRRVNDFVYNRFRDTFFNRFTHIHCPSNMIANQLRQHGYTARLHVISNGISPEYIYGKREKEPWMQGLFNVLMVGRYAGEKRQDELIDACAKSRHAREIQVILAGKGPLEKKYRRLAEKLPNPIVMEFYEPARLLEILHMADLYVHTSDAEIEAMSCMEAFACGLVPVIADSPRSATPQFALDERSLFPAGDTDALAQRIDWWIEHPEERQAMERRYAEHARQYSLEESIRQTEEMFRQAIAEQRGAKAQAPGTPNTRKNQSDGSAFAAVPLAPPRGCSLRVRQPLDGLLHGGHEKEVFAMIGLADKVPQRLAGVVGVVAVNGGLEPVVHQLLQDVSRHAGAENEKVAAHQALVDGQPGRAGLIPDGHGQVQGRTRVRDLHLPAGEHCDGAPRGLYGFDIHQNPPDRGGRPGGCRKTDSLSCQGAQRNCAVPAPISKWYLAMPRSTLV